MKIVYVLPNLKAKGGTERMITEKANYLTRHFGYEVYIICLHQNDTESNFFQLSKEVHQINLGINYYFQYKYKYPKRLFVKNAIHQLLKKELTKSVQAINPDILISVSYAKADLVCTIPCKAIKITECHEPKELVISKIYNSSFISKMYAKYYYYYVIEKYSDIIITLTNESKKNWEKAKRVEVIPNFISVAIAQKSNCERKRVIAVGRLNREKGYDRLINIWKSVSAKYSDWQLDIFGEGELKDELTHSIKDNGINNLSLRGASSDISKEYANSSICVVTSYFEGFSLVLLEALSHGVPCIAFDCPYGPRTIIEDGKCGYLVEDENIPLFVERLCALMENKSLRLKFSKASIERSKIFDKDAIMTQWKQLFENLSSTQKNM